MCVPYAIAIAMGSGGMLPGNLLKNHIPVIKCGVLVENHKAVKHMVGG